MLMGTFMGVRVRVRVHGDQVGQVRIGVDGALQNGR